VFLHLHTGGNEVTVEKFGAWQLGLHGNFPSHSSNEYIMNPRRALHKNCAHMEDKDSILFHLHTLHQFFLLMIVLQ